MNLTKLKIPLAKKLTKEDIESIEILISDLSSMGIHITPSSPLPDGSLLFEYNPKSYKRNAGRKKKNIPPNSVINKMSQTQMDNWLLNNTVETIENELKIGRTTAFRRRAEARKRLSYAMISLDKEENN